MNRNIFKQNKSDIIPLCFNFLNKSLSTENKINENIEQQQQSSLSNESNSIENNPYYSKYAEKIKKAQLLSIKPNDNKVITKEKPLINESISIEDDEKLKSEIKTIKESVVKTSNSCTKSKKRLDDIVKVDLLMDKSKEEIIQIWNLYHSKRDCLYAIIETSLYETYYKNLNEYSTFLLPLPRNSDDGKTSYEFFLMKFQEHCCHFTPLAAYHLHKEMAPVCLTIHYYPELSESKGIVLMVGEFDTNILNIVECQGLANQLQYYYLTKDPSAKLSLHLFNKEPQNFDHMRLIKHLENGFQAIQQQINLNQQD